MDQVVVLLVCFFIGLALLLMVMVYVESSLSRPKAATSALRRWRAHRSRDSGK